MIAPEIYQMYNILVSFLGNSKSPLDETFQLQFSCPHCQEREGPQERNKYHLEVNLINGCYNCWKCSSIDESMHGSIYKLIRKYGNPDLLKSYKENINAFRETSLYKLQFNNNEFALDYADSQENSLMLPKGFIKFQKGKHETTKAFQYLSQRGINWSIIEDYHMGFTTDQTDKKSLSNRIILPSFNEYGELNYWTGRDFTNNNRRQRYYNPIVERKDIIFNEENIQWNADITLVEGPFDAIVIPNSIPLLGKALNEDYKLFNSLITKAHANINIFLDNDAIETSYSLYNRLNQGRLKNRIKFIHIPNDERDLDPSKIFQLYGKQGIISFLNSAKKL